MGLLSQYTDGGIDPSQHEPNRDFTPLPPGWYPAEIESAEVVPTKAGTGQMLKLTLSVLGDSYAGRKLFHRINICNPSEKAQEIGRRELADIARAVNQAMLSDEDQLLGARLDVRVKVKRDQGYDPDNEIGGYRPLGGGQAPATPPPAAASSAQAPPSGTVANAPAPQRPEPAHAPAAGARLPWER